MIMKQRTEKKINLMVLVSTVGESGQNGREPDLNSCPKRVSSTQSVDLQQTVSMAILA